MVEPQAGAIRPAPVAPEMYMRSSACLLSQRQKQTKKAFDEEDQRKARARKAPSSRLTRDGARGPLVCVDLLARRAAI